MFREPINERQREVGRKRGSLTHRFQRMYYWHPYTEKQHRPKKEDL